jgi:hypothetical protein
MSDDLEFVAIINKCKVLIEDFCKNYEEYIIFLNKIFLGLADEKLNALRELNLFFAPTGRFQDLAIYYNFHDKYLVLASEFDVLYEGCISSSTLN